MDAEFRKRTRKIETGSSIAKLRYDLSALRYLLAAAEHQSFRRAADALGTYAATISRNVRRIEDVVGVPLFARSACGVRLTEAGRQFTARATLALQQLHHAGEFAGEVGRAKVGILNVGVITSLAGGFLRQLITEYKERHPGIKFDVQDGGRQEHLVEIRRRELDAAFFTGTEEIPDCTSVELWAERVHVALPRTHPLSECAELDWPDLKGEKFIVTQMPPGPEVHDYIVRRIASYSTYPNVERKSMLQETLMHMVSIGEGITVVSEAWTDMTFPDLALRPLADEADLVPFSMVWSPTNTNPALQQFIDLAHALAGCDRKPRCAP